MACGCGAPVHHELGEEGEPDDGDDHGRRVVLRVLLLAHVRHRVLEAEQQREDQVEEPQRRTASLPATPNRTLESAISVGNHENSWNESEREQQHRSLSHGSMLGSHETASQKYKREGSLALAVGG